MNTSTFLSEERRLYIFLLMPLLQVDPTLRKGGWTEEEDKKVVAAQSRLGNSWAKISKLLDGRCVHIQAKTHADIQQQLFSESRRKSPAHAAPSLAANDSKKETSRKNHVWEISKGERPLEGLTEGDVSTDIH